MRYSRFWFLIITIFLPYTVNAQGLYQLHSSGNIWSFTGVPCSSTSCSGWKKLDNNAKSKVIAADGNKLYQLHDNGAIWQFTGTPCSGNSCTGWQKLDNNPKTRSIAADGNKLYQLHDNGSIWQFTGNACSGNSCPGWQRLDNNPKTKAIAADGYKLYQLHDNGAIWQFTGTPCNGNSCPGWQKLDNNPKTKAMSANSNKLYQLHDNGEIWQFTGKPCNGNSCPGWQKLDNNPKTKSITSDGGELYQLHKDGAIWQFTGVPCSSNSCSGWRKLDNNSQTMAIAASALKSGEPIELEVVVIKVSNDDGSHDAGVKFSDDTIKALIDDTNAIFIPDAGIKLVLKEITTLKSTLINRLTDWSKPGCPDAEQTIPNPNPDFKGWFLSPSQYEAYQYSVQHYPKQIVVYVRQQTYDDNCNVVDEGGGGFSHSDLNFIALSSWGATGQLGVVFDGKPLQAPHAYLAHELGHYLGLTHTMPNEWPRNKNEATTQLNTFCQDNPSSITNYLPDVAWDFDLLSDTPGDPGFLLYNSEVFGIGEGDEYKDPNKNQCLGKGYFQVVSKSCQTLGGLYSDTFIVKPARDNLMSYTGQCPYLKGNTTGEIRARITPQQVGVIFQSLHTYRKNLRKTIDIPLLSLPSEIPIYEFQRPPKVWLPSKRQIAW